MKIEPKFKVGDNIFYIACINKRRAEFAIMQDQINHVEIGVYEEGINIEYRLRESYSFFPEERLYTNKNEAIDEFIKKLESMKDEEK